MSKTRTSQAELSYPATPFERFLWRRRRWLALASFAIAFLLTFVIGNYFGMRSGIEEARQSSQLQTAHALGLALYSYANDHESKYPVGKSSTEVFQQLMDDGYISDPTIFYFPMIGKTKAEGKKLKPENVCWDVTDALSTSDLTMLPLVFATGYKLDYVAGGKAQPLVNGDPAGMAVFYVSNAASFVTASTDGIHLLDPSFDPKGKTYRQLTPDGPLP